MKKKPFTILTILLSLSILACVFAETVAGQVLTGADGHRQDADISESTDNNSSIPLLLDFPTDTSQASNQITDGYYLFSPIRSTETYLMDSNGVAVFTWQSDYTPGHAVYFLDNGNLLRSGSLGRGTFSAGGVGGVIQEVAPDNSVVWEFQYADGLVQQHHDIEQLPNGNILLIAWELKTREEAIAAGRDPSLLDEGELWPDHVVEVDPATHEIVWEWHVWDHLIQDYDSSKPNYGMVADHPERIDLNYTVNRKAGADWNHTNSIDYNADLDQIILSVLGFGEIWIIDHNTTTEEAAGPAGDLLYRWGNPEAYDTGTAQDQQLFGQHDAQWIPTEYPGGGNILIFNNGDRRTRAYSSVDEIMPPLNSDGSYALTAGTADKPETTTWSYASPNDFYADHISGAQRLPNGNTLICSGTDGRFFEVTPAGEIAWEYNYGAEVFRVSQIAADHPGLASLALQPGDVLIGESGVRNQSSGGQLQDNGSPPQPAINACNGLVEGDACTVQLPKRTVNGSCQTIQNQLACAPDG